MPKLIIHRGTQEIGGSAVEINNGETRLLFDFGVPLDSMVREEWKPEDYKLPITGLYKNENPEFSAIFLTHAHPDHFGLMNLINPKIPIYISKTTYDILSKITPLISKQDYTKLNLKIIDDEINIKDIIVKVHKINHSIAGSVAYEIILEGKTIIYTGDIRFHGRASYLSSTFKRKIKNPDYLIMEGTTLGRKEQNIITENDLEDEFVKIFKSDKLPLVQFSPQNLDRFITIYRACLKAEKTLVIDPYTCIVLETYSKLSKHIPQYNWNNIRVNFSGKGINDKLAETKELYKFKSKKITIGEIKENPNQFVIKGNKALNRIFLKNFEKDKLNIVYSMWKGYLNRKNQFENYKDIITFLHTSGHAYIKDLQDFVREINPKNLIPVHTEHKEQFKELFKANIIELNDGEKLEI